MACLNCKYTDRHAENPTRWGEDASWNQEIAFRLALNIRKGHKQAC